MTIKNNFTEVIFRVIKNIILDVGGILFDDSIENIEKVLNKNCKSIYKKAYGEEFKECLLGHKTVQEHINSFYSTPYFNDISYILNKNNLSITYPLIAGNFEYIKKLKEKGYKIYLLTNITQDSYNYINSTINIDTVIDGGIYSYQEHCIKPNPNIYNLLINKFKLNKEETIFFDDREKNIIASCNEGIKGIVFKSINDIEYNLHE